MSANAKKDHAHQPNLSSQRATFEGIREVVARVESAQAGPRADADGPQALQHIRIACQPGGALHTGTECRRCARFVNWLPSPDRFHVTVRCLWRESDRAMDLMARASVIPTVTEERPVGEAALQAAAAGASFLVVVEDASFRGILRTEDIDVEPRAMVRERMIRPTWSVPADATLRDVVEVMKKHATDVVPVLAAGDLLGIITRVALCDAGLACAFEEP
ncbi:MAG TPA: CBS domain-containing protein [Haliangium sp.]|nr:CBS domain-containing protein [Haliangium sp.]